jgi:FtsZ-binding cell division protein ZapB
MEQNLITIDNSGLLVNGATTVNSSLNISGTTILNGATSVNSSLNISGTTNINSTLNVSRTTILNGTTTINSSLIISGNLGIGNSSPSFKADINGILRAQDYIVIGKGTTEPILRLQKNNVDSESFTYWYDTTNNRIDTVYRNSGGGDTILNTLLTSGNFGIGTTNPLSKLQIDFNRTASTGLTSYSSLHLAPSTNIDGSFNGITFGANDQVAGLRTNTQAGILCQSSSQYGTKLYFLTSNDFASGQQNRVVIDPAGNVGIGTTNPSTLLHVSGTSILNGATSINSTLNVSNSQLQLASFRKTNDTGLTFIEIGGSTLENAVYIGSEEGSVTIGKRGVIEVFRYNTSGNTLLPAGNIGIGTSTPNGKLHVSGTSILNGATSINSSLNVSGISILNGATTINSTLNMTGETLTIASGSNNCSISVNRGYGASMILNPGGQTGARSYNLISTANGAGAGDGKLAIYDNTASAYRSILCNSSGYMGIGTTDPAVPLHVVGSADQTIGPVVYYSEIPNTSIEYAYYGSSSLASISIRADRDIWAYAFWASSDSRIKKNIIDIDDNEALNKLLLVQPKKYNYIDIPKKGNKTVFGFIAQQIKEVIPEAISLQKEYIPSKFNNYIIIDKKITINNHGLTEGQNIRIYDKNNKQIDKPIHIIDENTIEVLTNEDIQPTDDSKVFVYGEEVEDFHIVDKNYIYTINVCATQELARKIQTLEQEKETMKTKLDTLQNDNNILKMENQNLKNTINTIIATLNLNIPPVN